MEEKDLAISGARGRIAFGGLHIALNSDAPTRGWLEASAVVDGIDAAPPQHL